MLHFTLCGGSDVRLKEEDNMVVTVCGGTVILLPTIAEKMIRIKKHDSNPSDYPLERRTNVITVMGGTDWTKPTIAREIEEMIQLRNSGAISDEEVSHYWKRAMEEPDMDVFETITLMGGAGENGPSREVEWKAMERLCLMGMVSPDELEEFRKMLDGSFSKSRAGFLQDKIRELLQPSEIPARLPLSSSPLPNTALE
jgi:hypothetical protein